MAWHSQKHEGARSALTLNSMVREAMLACSPWLGSGQPKRKSFCALAAKAKSGPHFIKFQAQAAWLCKWSSILWCASAATFSQPLLAVSVRLEADGTIPSVYERRCVLFRSSFVNVAYVCYVCLSCRSRLENIFGAPSQLFRKKSSPPSFQSPFLFVPRLFFCTTEPSSSNLSRRRRHSLTSNRTSAHQLGVCTLHWRNPSLIRALVHLTSLPCQLHGLRGVLNFLPNNCAFQ